MTCIAPPCATPTCAPRNVYIDAGVNWCNTLTLNQRVPQARGRTNWHVFGFEASRRIVPFADQCARALSAGEPLPEPPLPPAGSSKELAKYASSYNCSMPQLGLRPESLHDVKVYRRQLLLPCMIGALAQNLSRVRPVPALSAPGLLRERLALGKRCTVARTSSYVMLPAAAGESEGTLAMVDSDVGLLVGGRTLSKIPPPSTEKYRVAMVDFSAWLRASFTEADFVILKMDVEGGEHKIVPKMVADGTLRLVDVWLWECHHMPNWMNSPCFKLKRMLRDNGVGTIYEDPYPF
ncbi:hypothetical protein EMIHUDRAFT_356662 [Emiliania huxleyi CCMP1516]|uniref:Methyltransferase FkbM domain-containing protein n=2 Tax=Emiliania huxleyi TaxID=2903 RepID=A0A0D3IT37_EMIH1|nr:hypothetical protein EMIHUDRAFT_356662 [Emiliania huxleyi CCMP1516]EOD14422.1 hypothetical protein EMIHUDRAFT_356662 [Emiliania huxleyi CCMP1516]|eukprot:XP_005766851.1 hypothetical protein EMIHUDRAFT_356662 [Emiliania huxleyi CCMP1516]